jgi:GDP-L-fucose synthase
VFVGSKDCDLLNLDEVKQLFEQENPDFVIHLAACVGGLFKNINYKVDMYEKNTLINCNILKCCHDYKVKKVVSCLSTCIFPDKTTYPINEEMLHEGPPHPSNYAYAYAKRMLEVQSRICYEQFGLKYNCVIPTNIYGTNDDFNLETGHVVASLIRKAFETSKTGEDFVVWGDGKQQRDFLFTEDVAKLTLWTLENYFEKEPLIFSNNTPIEIGYVAGLIAKKFGIEKKLVFDTSKPSGQKIRKLSGNKLASIFDFKFTPIEEGISRSVEWFISNYPKVRL